jgi:hypothetical protein
VTLDISYNEKKQFVLVKTTGDYSITDVDDFLNKSIEKYRFADTVSQNWSMGILRFFDDCELAKKWLLE